MQNNTPIIFFISPFTPSPTMPEVLVELFVISVFFFIAMFTCPYPLINSFMTQRTFSCFISFSTDQLWAPFIHCELFYNQLFHGKGEKHLLGFILMPLIRFSLGIRSDIICPEVLPLLAVFRSSSLQIVEG